MNRKAFGASFLYWVDFSTNNMNVKYSKILKESCTLAVLKLSYLCWFGPIGPSGQFQLLTLLFFSIISYWLYQHHRNILTLPVEQAFGPIEKRWWFCQQSKATDRLSLSRFCRMKLFSSSFLLLVCCSKFYHHTFSHQALRDSVKSYVLLPSLKSILV